MSWPQFGSNLSEVTCQTQAYRFRLAFNVHVNTFQPERKPDTRRMLYPRWKETRISNLKKKKDHIIKVSFRAFKKFIDSFSYPYAERNYIRMLNALAVCVVLPWFPSQKYTLINITRDESEKD